MLTPPAPDSNQQAPVITVQAYPTPLLRLHPNMRVISLSLPTNSLQCKHIEWSFKDNTHNHPLSQA